MTVHLRRTHAPGPRLLAARASWQQVDYTTKKLRLREGEGAAVPPAPGAMVVSGLAAGSWEAAVSAFNTAGWGGMSPSSPCAALGGEEGDDDDAVAVVGSRSWAERDRALRACAVDLGGRAPPAAQAAQAGRAVAATGPAHAAPGAKRKAPPPGADEPSQGARPRRERVTEGEVVTLLARHGRMRLADLVTPFKPQIRNQQDKADFMELLKLVGRLEMDGGEVHIVLEGATKHEHGACG